MGGLIGGTNQPLQLVARIRTYASYHDYHEELRYQGTTRNYATKELRYHATTIGKLQYNTGWCGVSCELQIHFSPRKNFRQVLAQPVFCVQSHFLVAIK